MQPQQGQCDPHMSSHRYAGRNSTLGHNITSLKSYGRLYFSSSACTLHVQQVPTAKTGFRQAAELLLPGHGQMCMLTNMAAVGRRQKGLHSLRPLRVRLCDPCWTCPGHLCWAHSVSCLRSSAQVRDWPQKSHYVWLIRSCTIFMLGL